MAVKSRTLFLRVQIEGEEGDRVFVSIKQSDLSVNSGEVSKDQLLGKLLRVEVVRESEKEVLITWPVKCVCLHEQCSGDTFWVLKELLI